MRGDRDALKRPRMARIAAKLSHVVYVTSDKSADEEPEKIIDQITAGFSDKDREKVLLSRIRRAGD